MNIRFFLLGAEKHNSLQRIEAELEYVFSDYLAEKDGVQSFTELKDASDSIAKAVENTHAVVFLADYSQYSDTKLMLSRIFGFQLSCDPELLDKACKTFNKSKEEDYTFSVTHAFVAPNSRIFVMEDGAYAGFAVANGNQTIILLPLDSSRTSTLLSQQVIPYLNATYHVSINTARLKTFNTGKLAEKCLENDIKIAVAGTNTASYFKEYSNYDERLKNIITISPITEKRGSMSPVDYIVNLSITAAEFFDCRYGVAMSNAFYTGDSPESEKIVYMTVTNERQSAVRELHSFPGEDIPAFLDRCCADLCNFIIDTLNNDEEYIKEISEKEKSLAKRYKISIITVASLIAAMSIFCGVFFHINNYSMKDWYTNFKEWIFPGGFPFSFSDIFGGNDEEATEGNVAPETTTEASSKDRTPAYIERTTAKHDAEETTASSEETTKEENTTEKNTDTPPSQSTTDASEPSSSEVSTTNKTEPTSAEPEPTTAEPTTDPVTVPEPSGEIPDHSGSLG